MSWGRNRRMHLGQPTGVVGAARKEGLLRNVGGPAGRGVATLDVALGDGPAGRRRGSQYPRSRSTPVEGRGLTSGALLKERRVRGLA